MSEIQQIKRQLGTALLLQKSYGIFYKGEDGFTWQLSCNVGNCPYCQQGISSKYPEQGICLLPQICIEKWDLPLDAPLIGVMGSRFPFFSYSMYKCDTYKEAKQNDHKE